MIIVQILLVITPHLLLYLFTPQSTDSSNVSGPTDYLYTACYPVCVFNDNSTYCDYSNTSEVFCCEYKRFIDGYYRNALPAVLEKNEAWETHETMEGIITTVNIVTCLEAICNPIFLALSYRFRCCVRNK
eukprot:311397_1